MKNLLLLIVDFSRKACYNIIGKKNDKMANIFDVAKYILEKKGRMSTWKLQKLCYYAQAWSLAWTEKPLFDEDFQAWSNGLVCPELFHEHQGKFYIDKTEFTAGNSEFLNDEQKENIDIVVKDYGDMEPYDLREISHSEKPWIDARGDLKEGERGNNVISKNVMGEYYGSL